jgi:hypothetical protein
MRQARRMCLLSQLHVPCHITALKLSRTQPKYCRVMILWQDTLQLKEVAHWPDNTIMLKVLPRAH